MLVVTIKTLEENETIIQHGVTASFEAGKALAEIRDNRLYKGEFSSFDNYCQLRWGKTRQYVSLLISSNKVIENLSTIVDTLPQSEGQTREIAKAPIEDQADVWLETQEVTGKDQPTALEIKQVVENKPMCAIFTGNNEWYTPKKYIESARLVMGSIDLDPASNDKAQEVVRAKEYFTINDDGLSKQWNGNIWMNPPYSAKEIKLFIAKLFDIKTSFNSAIVLTNNSADTSWFNSLANRSDAMCFTTGRISFYNSDGESSAPTNGQTFFYFGDHSWDFMSEFKQYGLIMKVVNVD